MSSLSSSSSTGSGSSSSSSSSASSSPPPPSRVNTIPASRRSSTNTSGNATHNSTLPDTLSGHNPVALQQFANAVAEAEDRKRLLQEGIMVQPRGSINHNHTHNHSHTHAATADDYLPKTQNTPLLLKRPSMTRQPSAPSLGQWNDNEPGAPEHDNNAMPRKRSIDMDGTPGEFKLAVPSPSLGPRVQSLPMAGNFLLSNDDAVVKPQYGKKSPLALAPSTSSHMPTAYSINEPQPPTTSHVELERKLSFERSKELEIHSKGLGRRQLRAMLKKNFLLKIRNPVQCFCEIFSPLLIIMVLVIGYFLSLPNVTKYGDERFADDTHLVEEVFEWVQDHIVPAPAYDTHQLFPSHAFPSHAMRSLSADDPPAPPAVNQTCFPLTALPGKQFCYDSSDTSILKKMMEYNGPMHIPSFDEYVETHYVLSYLLNETDVTSAAPPPTDPSEMNYDQMSRFDKFSNGELANLIWLGKLIFCPDNPGVQQLVQSLNLTHSLFDSVFSGIVPDENMALAEAAAVQTNADRIWAIVVVDNLDLDAGIMHLRIRMNSSVLPTTQSTIDKFQMQGGIDDDYKRYYFSGFLTLQTMLEGAALNYSSEISGSSYSGDGTYDDSIPINPYGVSNQTLTAIPFPIYHFEGNSYYQTMGPIAGLVFCMSMLYPTSRLIKSIVEEKETKTKETMKIMGLKDWVFHTSWFVTFVVQCLITNVALVLLLHFTMFPRADVSLLFCFFLCFFLSEISLGFLVTVFFNRSKLAGIVGPIILFALTIPRYAFFSHDSSNNYAEENANSQSVLAKTFCSLFSPTAFTFGADLLMAYEGANLSLNWTNFTSDSSFSMGKVMTFLLLDFVIYAALALYFDHVMPNEYGQKLHPLFCFKKSFWATRAKRKRRQSMDEGEDLEEGKLISDSAVDSESESSVTGASRDNAVVEPVPASMHAQARVHVKNLTKAFDVEGNSKDKKHLAVAGLNLTLYEGQITALLGHNGAGKSTSISMLTGLIAPTSGDCSIHGYSILTNMNEIRKSLGVCPQSNVLFAKLTVEDHLKLYATLKGVKDADLQAEVNRKIEEIGLSDKRNVYSSALSGGMQRKLQCAMAFIGGSKVVFLDEPTAGMDPTARRSFADLLRSAKQDRTIVLCTHFMDEAELLGDRVAIMSEGKLKCVGSSLFLKSKYGIGYHLTLVKSSKRCRLEQVAKMVMFFCPEAKLLSTAGGEISFRLPWSCVGQFPGLLSQLEERRHEMGIGGFGISQTTLEEVFLRCAQINADEEEEANQIAAAKSIEDCDTEKKALIVEGKPRKSSFNQAPTQATVAQQTFEAQSDTVIRISPMDDKHTSIHSEYNKLLDLPNSNSFDAAANAVRPHPTLAVQFKASLLKRYQCAVRDRMGRFFELVLPVLVVLLILVILKLNVPTNGANLNMKGELYQSSSSGSAPFWFSSESAARMEPGTVYSLNYARGAVKPNTLFDMMPTIFDDSVQMTEGLLQTSQSHTGRRYGAFIYNDTIVTQFNHTIYEKSHPLIDHPILTVMHNTTYFHSLPVLVSEIATARWNANRWRQNRAQPLSQVSYELHNHPLPSTSTPSLRTRTYLTLFAALFMLIPFCYLPASFVLFVVKERSVKSKHIQFVSGLNPTIYWLSTWVWDMINYSIIAIAIILVIVAFRNEQFAGDFESSLATFSLISLYGLAAIPLAYCYSFGFGNYTSAQVGIAGLNFLTGFVLVITSFMLDNISSMIRVNRQLKNIYRIFPSFTLGEGLINMAMRDFNALVNSNTHEKLSPFAWQVLGRDLTYLLVESVVFFLLTLLMESNSWSRFIRMCFNFSGEKRAHPDEYLPLDEDDDVARERRRVEKLEVEPAIMGADGYAVASVQLDPSGTPVTTNRTYQPQWAMSLNATETHVKPPVRRSSFSSLFQSKSKSAEPVQLESNLQMPLLNPNDEKPFEAMRRNSKVDSSSVSILLSDDKGSYIPPSPMPPMPPRELAPIPASPFQSSPLVPSPVAQSPDSLYDDAARASESVDDPSFQADDILVLQNLRKVYPARGNNGKSTVAVQDLSLGIPRGQVFGFLGINGAGKTTTMKMLTGDIPISKGRAYINGFNVATQLDQVRKEIGYCPQFDPLLDLMTARETLTLYGRLRGLAPEGIDTTVDRLLTTLGLTKFSDKICGSYSGGNKRKLSLAIALIGDPSLVFLDEPSTGLDPVSARFMWSVIDSFTEGRSVILTTHSMEECEALANRLGIMVNGALRCLGSIQHLKSRFGSFYSMDINANESSSLKVQAFVSRNYPLAILDEVQAGRLKYRLPQQGISLSSMFSTMEANKRTLDIVDYAISQCSLEQIFLDQVKKGDA